MSSGQAPANTAAGWQRTFADLYRIGAGYAVNAAGGSSSSPQRSFNLNRASGSLFQLGNDLGGDIGGSVGSGVGTAFRVLEEAGQIERNGFSIPLNASLFSQSPLNFGSYGGMHSNHNGIGGGPSGSTGSRFQWSANMNIGGPGESAGGGNRSMFSTSALNTGDHLPGSNVFGGSGPASANPMAVGMVQQNGMGGPSGSGGIGGPGSSGGPGGGKGRSGVSGPSLSLHLSF